MKSDRRYIEFWPDSNIHAEWDTHETFTPTPSCILFNRSQTQIHDFNSHLSAPKCQLITATLVLSQECEWLCWVSQCVSLGVVSPPPLIHDTRDMAHNGQGSVARMTPVNGLMKSLREV